MYVAVHMATYIFLLEIFVYKRGIAIIFISQPKMIEKLDWKMHENAK